MPQGRGLAYCTLLAPKLLRLIFKRLLFSWVISAYFCIAVWLSFFMFHILLFINNFCPLEIPPPSFALLCLPNVISLCLCEIWPWPAFWNFVILLFRTFRKEQSFFLLFVCFLLLYKCSVFDVCTQSLKKNSILRCALSGSMLNCCMVCLYPSFDSAPLLMCSGCTRC